LISAAALRRNVAKTSMNGASSRGHALFQLVLESGARLCIVDLAGRENEKTTRCRGQTLAELGYINKSLFHLTNVIQALARRNSGNLIPFRNSKLTLLLSDCLQSARTFLLATVGPAASNFDETLTTLRLASSVRGITTRSRRCSLRVNQEIALRAEESPAEPQEEPPQEAPTPCPTPPAPLVVDNTAALASPTSIGTASSVASTSSSILVPSSGCPPGRQARFMNTPARLPLQPMSFAPRLDEEVLRSRDLGRAGAPDAPSDVASWSGGGGAGGATVTPGGGVRSGPGGGGADAWARVMLTNRERKARKPSSISGASSCTTCSTSREQPRLPSGRVSKESREVLDSDSYSLVEEPWTPARSDGPTGIPEIIQAPRLINGCQHGVSRMSTT